MFVMVWPRWIKFFYNATLVFSRLIPEEAKTVQHVDGMASFPGDLDVTDIGSGIPAGHHTEVHMIDLFDTASDLQTRTAYLSARKTPPFEGGGISTSDTRAIDGAVLVRRLFGIPADSR